MTTVYDMEAVTHCLCRALSRDSTVSYSTIPDLPKAACQILDKEFVRSTSTVEKCQTSSDGTRKLLVRLQDGLEVESVIMVYDTASEYLLTHSYLNTSEYSTYAQSSIDKIREIIPPLLPRGKSETVEALSFTPLPTPPLMFSCLDEGGFLPE